MPANVFWGWKADPTLPGPAAPPGHFTRPGWMGTSNVPGTARSQALFGWLMPSAYNRNRGCRSLCDPHTCDRERVARWMGCKGPLLGAPLPPAPQRRRLEFPPARCCALLEHRRHALHGLKDCVGANIAGDREKGATTAAGSAAAACSRRRRRRLLLPPLIQQLVYVEQLRRGVAAPLQLLRRHPKEQRAGWQ